MGREDQLKQIRADEAGAGVNNREALTQAIEAQRELINRHIAEVLKSAKISIRDAMLMSAESAGSCATNAQKDVETWDSLAGVLIGDDSEELLPVEFADDIQLGFRSVRDIVSDYSGFVSGNLRSFPTGSELSVWVSQGPGKHSSDMPDLATIKEYRDKLNYLFNMLQSFFTDVMPKIEKVKQNLASYIPAYSEKARGYATYHDPEGDVRKKKYEHATKTVTILHKQFMFLESSFERNIDSTLKLLRALNVATLQSEVQANEATTFQNRE